MKGRLDYGDRTPVQEGHRKYYKKQCPRCAVFGVVKLISHHAKLCRQCRGEVSRLTRSQMSRFLQLHERRSSNGQG